MAEKLRNRKKLAWGGKVLKREVLFSGTAEGIDVAVFLASMLAQEKL